MLHYYQHFLRAANASRLDAVCQVTPSAILQRTGASRPNLNRNGEVVSLNFIPVTHKKIRASMLSVALLSCILWGSRADA